MGSFRANQSSLCKQEWYSYIRVAFREPHPEKQSLEVKTQNYIQKNHTYLSYSGKLIVIQKDYGRSLYRSTERNSEGAENFIKLRIEEICE